MLQLWVKHNKFCHLGNEICPTNKNVLLLNAATDINCRLNNLLPDFSHYKRLYQIVHTTESLFLIVELAITRSKMGLETYFFK